ncbi:arsenic resistance N-acetyltransferase ArsN2 [Caballeronia telluris]|uniref:GCN5-related N-acetyltransferase n=1 Tax=Caballeronia telluris TaxID=326475 RepID=A0A158KKC5_9BURK|nr:arsenic resistance N-acetyltransferase ArsN2 [Caballeronia telluris]SAL81534.1 GCN5-related N-acetyltransferase [Caballeronia telluris]
MNIRAARTEDLDAIAALLAENGLSASDVTPDQLRDFAVAEDAHGSVVGSVGLEGFGAEALLRSLAVAKPERSAGLGTKLLLHAEYMALTLGVSELWLLTTTATDFFRRAGYLPVARPSAPTGLQSSTQFAQLCPSTAVCMKKKLKPNRARDPAVDKTAKH